jgi:DnaJ-domain-containing protein 1
MKEKKMESRDYLEMSFQSINCFSDDGKLDAVELRKIFNIALRDGVVDQNELRVLRQIIAKLKPEELNAEMLEMIESIKNEIAAVN